MIDILQKIANQKKVEAEFRKQEFPLTRLSESPFYGASPRKLSMELKNMLRPAIIAEFKRASPSKGMINEQADPTHIGIDYQKNGAAAISVLTDQEFFRAKHSDFEAVRSQVQIPMLRKDFIIDAYQIHESKAMGADIVLLIAAILSPGQAADLAAEAQSLELDVLLEIHQENELDRLSSWVTLAGINNRNLRDFTVNISHSAKLLNHLPDGIPAIAESGLNHPEVVVKLYQQGFSAFLMGEHFMKTEDPGQTLKEFQNKVSQLIDA